MNQDQFMSTVRWVLSVTGPLLASWGMVSSATWAQISGVVIAVAPYIWSMWSHTQLATINKVAAMTTPAGTPLVQMTVAPSPVTGKIVAETPPNVTAAPS